MSNNLTNNPWKDDVGRWKLGSLFIDFGKDPEVAKFTTYETDLEVDGKTFPSLRKLYLAFEHLPGYEYDFSVKYLGGWQHFQKMASSPILGPIIAEWREELEVKTQATALRQMVGVSFEDSPSGYAAKRFLATKEWQAKRGRPSNEEKEKNIRIQTKVSEEIASDLERIRLVK